MAEQPQIKVTALVTKPNAKMWNPWESGEEEAMMIDYKVGEKVPFHPTPNT